MGHPDVDPAILQAAAARRGRPHVYEEIVPARTALVVIDLQNAFVRPGAPSEVPNARTIVPTVNRLADMLRKSGGTVALARDAVMCTIMVSDCNAARTDAEHLSALGSFLTGFGDVRRSNDLIAKLSRSSVAISAVG